MSADQLQYSVVAAAIRFIRDNAQRQPTLGEIGVAVGVSEHHLQRVFSAWAGISPKRFLQYLTKQHALKLLSDSRPLIDAALESGLSGTGRLHDLILSCEAMTPGQVKSGGDAVTINYGFAETPFGKGLFAWTDKGVCFLEFCEQPATTANLFKRWPAADFNKDQPGAERLAAQIFARQPEAGKLHLVLKGTNFQIKVWEALLSTQPGQLISYSGLARIIDAPNAQRAVGSAVGANPLAYLIPCHRVIRETGELGQYRWGIERKTAVQVWEAAGAEG